MCSRNSSSLNIALCFKVFSLVLYNLLWPLGYFYFSQSYLQFSLSDKLFSLLCWDKTSDRREIKGKGLMLASDFAYHGFGLIGSMAAGNVGEASWIVAYWGSENRTETGPGSHLQRATSYWSFYNLPRQHHELRVKFSNPQSYVGIFYF